MDALERPGTVTGDTKHILTEDEYNTARGHSPHGMKGLEAQWRQTHNEPLGPCGERSRTSPQKRRAAVDSPGTAIATQYT